MKDKLMTLCKGKSGIITTVAVAVIFIVVVSVLIRNLQPQDSVYTNSEIDFEDSKIAYHTEDQGIAVIPVSPKNRPETPPVSSPDEIWEKDTGHSYGGFTLPEAAKMNDESIGILTINDIGVSARVYESEDEMEAMNKGVAHFKSTSAWMGNIALSAHNVNFNGTDGYFKNLYTLKKGAVIQYETALGVREYVVNEVKEIPENDMSSLARTEDNRLTLITCISGKPTMRLMVTAKENFS